MSSKRNTSGPVLLQVLKQSFKIFSVNDPLRMAAATAFFTTFALPPILIIITQVLGLIFNDNIIRKVFSRLSVTIGRTSTHQIVDTLKAFREMANNWYVTLIGLLFLIFIATNLFKIIKDSINQIWKIKMVAKQSIWQTLRTRGYSLAIIIITGMIFGLAILAEGMQTYLGDVVVSILPELGGYLNSVFSNAFSVVLVTVWFFMLFRFLTDGRPLWKIALAGALFTSVLFNIGKFILRVSLDQSNLNNLYGASAAIVLLMLFVFYSSFILYFGAAFTKAWADHYKKPIMPNIGAVRYRWSEISEE